MLTSQAKILTKEQAGFLLIYAGSTRHPQRDRLIVLLSVKAGLRAGEIAGLTWDMVLGANGDLAGCIELRDLAAKANAGEVAEIMANKDAVAASALARSLIL